MKKHRSRPTGVARNAERVRPPRANSSQVTNRSRSKSIPHVAGRSCYAEVRFYHEQNWGG